MAWDFIHFSGMVNPDATTEVVPIGIRKMLPSSTLVVIRVNRFVFLSRQEQFSRGEITSSSMHEAELELANVCLVHVLITLYMPF
jgi:hypothetical protein